MEFDTKIHLGRLKLDGDHCPQRHMFDLGDCWVMRAVRRAGFPAEAIGAAIHAHVCGESGVVDRKNELENAWASLGVGAGRVVSRYPYMRVDKGRGTTGFLVIVTDGVGSKNPVTTVTVSEK